MRGLRPSTSPGEVFSRALKPEIYVAVLGTTEVVPLQSNFPTNHVLKFASRDLPLDPRYCTFS
jgi:hypothetical protein